MAFLAIPSILVLGVYATYYGSAHYLHKNYPAPVSTKYKVGEEVEVNGNPRKVIGYTGHDKKTANNLILEDHPVWIAETRVEAQKYAGNNGAVATIAADQRAATAYSRFENGITADYPKKEHGYTVVDVEELSPSTDDRTKACLKRMISDLQKKERN